MPIRRTIAALVLSLPLAALARPASADITVFLGSVLTPSHHTTTGVAVGVSMVIVAFEFEYASASQDVEGTVPGLRTGMFSGMVQTPGGLGGLQLYVAAGAGIYRETLVDAKETNFAIGVGGGAKIDLVGPLRLRLDYRLLRLRGTPMHERVHRIYAGLNLKF